MIFHANPGVIDLGVNIDHVATLRNARGTVYPDPIQAALQAEEAGADLITLHLREDRRHIRDADVRALRPKLATRMNLECAITAEMLDIACEIKPQDVCLVPEKREEVTTEGGLDVAGHFEQVSAACRQLADAGIRVSLFIDADPDQIAAAAACKAPVIEIHTGAYADAHTADAQEAEFQRVAEGVMAGQKHGLIVNAGHGLHYTNVQRIAALPGIKELNIGHAIVAHAVFVGWQNAVREMKAIMVAARLGTRYSVPGASGVIYGVGTDIIQIDRVQGVMDRTRGRFAEKVLGPRELKIYHARKARSEKRGLAFLATRFAAKEAFSKAIGLGMRWPMTWRAMELLNLPSGEPTPQCTGELADWVRERGLTIRVSVSDEHEYAVAFAIAERTAQPGPLPEPASN